MGKLGDTLFLFSLSYICINLLKNVDLTLSLHESVLVHKLFLAVPRCVALGAGPCSRSRNLGVGAVYCALALYPETGTGGLLVPLAVP